MSLKASSVQTSPASSFSSQASVQEMQAFEASCSGVQALAVVLDDTELKQIFQWVILAAMALQIPVCYDEIVKIAGGNCQTVSLLLLVGLLPSIVLKLHRDEETPFGQDLSVDCSNEDAFVLNEEYRSSEAFRRSMHRDESSKSESNGTNSPEELTASGYSTAAYEWGQFAELEDDLPDKDLSFILDTPISTQYSSVLMILQETDEDE